MQRLLIYITIAALMLAGGFYAYKYWRSYTREQQTIKAVKDARGMLIDSLKDPLSAQFRSDSLFQQNKVVCGEINAKNSLGGYVGFKRYIAKSGQYIIEGASFASWDLKGNVEEPPTYYVDAISMIDGRGKASATTLESISADAMADEIFRWLWKTNCL